MRKRSYAYLVALGLLVSVAFGQSALASFSSVNLQVSDGSVTSTAPAAIATSEDSIMGFRGSDGYPHSLICGPYIVCDFPSSGTSTPGTISLSETISNMLGNKESLLGEGVEGSVLMYQDNQRLWNVPFNDYWVETPSRVFITADQREHVANLSGTNTGDQDLSGLVPKSTTVNGQALTGNITVSASTTASGITDSTATGRALVTASDAAAARSAIGAGTGSGTVANASSTDLSVSGNGTDTLTLNLGTVGTSGTYSNVTTDSKGRVVSGTAPSFTSVTRAIDGCFQASSTRDALVKLNYSLSNILTLTSASVVLESFSNSGCTTGTVELDRMGSGGIALNPSTVQSVFGPVLAGRWYKARLVGSATVTANVGWEYLP